MIAKGMRKIVTAALMVVAAVAVFCGAGCNSYRVCGYAPAGSRSSEALKHTYNLQRIELRNVNTMPIILWTTEYALSKMPISAYERLVTKNRPDVFAERPDSIPISIELTLRSSTGSLGWTILVPYLVSFGVFPAYIQYDDVCGVTVRRLDLPYATPEATFTFQHKTKVTAFSPIGLGGFEPDPAAIVERSGKGILSQPEININVRNNIAEALATTISATVVEQLRQMERIEITVAPSVPQTPPPAGNPPPPAGNPPQPADNPPPPESAAVNTDSSSTGAASLPELLQKLKDLRASGAITEQEYVDMTMRIVNQSK